MTINSEDKDKSIETLVNEVYTLLGNGRRHAAADIIFEKIDGLFSVEDFAKVDEILKSFDIERLDESIMASILAITYPARHHLDFRARFFDDVKRVLCERLPDRVDNILKNLK